MENNHKKSEIELPATQIFGHVGSELLQKKNDSLGMKEGFRDNQENLKIELPKMLDKKLYWFSEEAEKLIGYKEATTKAGEKFKYTALGNGDDYLWPDKKIVGEFSDAEIKTVFDFPAEENEIKTVFDFPVKEKKIKR